MELLTVSEVSIPKSNAPMEYVIDREEFLRLHEEGLIQNKLYVYVAINLSYSHSEPSIDIPSFCEQWDLNEADFSTAITQLQKKGALQPVPRQLTLQLF